jgi:hypothetical protein
VGFETPGKGFLEYSLKGLGFRDPPYGLGFEDPP